MPAFSDIFRVKQVDVWSAGILLYQMLFGRRPFGHDQTQERILREDTIIKARKVEFPSRPTVSNEAKVTMFLILTTFIWFFFCHYFHLFLLFFLLNEGKAVFACTLLFSCHDWDQKEPSQALRIRTTVLPVNFRFQIPMKSV